MSTSNINQLEKDLTSASFDEIIIDPLTRKAMSSILLETVDPILVRIIEAIKPIIAELVISERRILIQGLDLVSISEASQKTSVPIPTIYSWIGNGLIDSFIISSKTHISLAQLSNIIKTKSYSKKL